MRNIGIVPHDRWRNCWHPENKIKKKLQFTKLLAWNESINNATWYWKTMLRATCLAVACIIPVVPLYILYIWGRLIWLYIQEFAITRLFIDCSYETINIFKVSIHFLFFASKYFFLVDYRANNGKLLITCQRNMWID